MKMKTYFPPKLPEGAWGKKGFSARPSTRKRLIGTRQCLRGLVVFLAIFREVVFAAVQETDLTSARFVIHRTKNAHKELFKHNSDLYNAYKELLKHTSDLYNAYKEQALQDSALRHENKTLRHENNALKIKNNALTKKGLRSESLLAAEKEPLASGQYTEMGGQYTEMGGQYTEMGGHNVTKAAVSKEAAVSKDNGKNSGNLQLQPDYGDYYGDYYGGYLRPQDYGDPEKGYSTVYSPRSQSSQYVPPATPETIESEKKQPEPRPESTPTAETVILRAQIRKRHRFYCGAQNAADRRAFYCLENCFGAAFVVCALLLVFLFWAHRRTLARQKRQAVTADID